MHGKQVEGMGQQGGYCADILLLISKASFSHSWDTTSVQRQTKAGTFLQGELSMLNQANSSHPSRSGLTSTPSKDLTPAASLEQENFLLKEWWRCGSSCVQSVWGRTVLTGIPKLVAETPHSSTKPWPYLINNLACGPGAFEGSQQV